MIFPKVKINSSISKETLSIGFIGTGLRGQWLLDLASKRDDVVIPAICDIEDRMIDRALKIIKSDKLLVKKNFIKNYLLFFG